MVRAPVHDAFKTIEGVLESMATGAEIIPPKRAKEKVWWATIRSNRVMKMANGLLAVLLGTMLDLILEIDLLLTKSKKIMPRRTRRIG